MTSQRRDPRIDQFCDQLLAQLRDSPSPLTTREVAAGIRVRRIELWPVRGGPTARVGDTVRGRCIISCEGTDQRAMSCTWSPSPHRSTPSTAMWPRSPRAE